MYGLRHGGASYDLLHKRRPLHSIKIRGRWTSDASLKRYAKESRLIQETHKIPRPTLEFGMAVEKPLELSFRVRPPVRSPMLDSDAPAAGPRLRKRPAAA